MKEEKLSQILTCILFFMLGIMLLIATESFLETLNYILVCIFALIGVLLGIRFVIHKEYLTHVYTNLFLGVTFLWLSMFIYVYYSMIVIILPIIFSLYSFIMFVTFIMRYFDCVSEKREKRNLIFAIISLVLGLVLMFRPALSVYTYFKIAGIYVLLIAGVSSYEFVRSIRKK